VSLRIPFWEKLEQFENLRRRRRRPENLAALYRDRTGAPKYLPVPDTAPQTPGGRRLRWI
jgi:hypothetical protein